MAKEYCCIFTRRLCNKDSLCSYRDIRYKASALRLAQKRTRPDLYTVPTVKHTHPRHWLPLSLDGGQALFGESLCGFVNAGVVNDQAQTLRDSLGKASDYNAINRSFDKNGIYDSCRSDAIWQM